MDTGNPAPISRANNTSVEAQVRLTRSAKKQEEAVSTEILEGVQKAADEIRAQEQGVGANVNVSA